MNIWAIILAAGQSTRLSQCGLEQKKQFIEHKGIPLFWHSVLTFAACPGINGIIIAFPPDELDHCKEVVKSLLQSKPPGIPVFSTAGGKMRQDSVYNALLVLPDECDHVMVHDAARPFFTAELLTRLIQGYKKNTGGVIPVIPCKDTIKMITSDLVVTTLNRDELAMVQTPQFFPRSILVDAHHKAKAEGFCVTDDASTVEKSGYLISTVAGIEHNQKITTPEDLKMIHDSPRNVLPCTGFGYDVHRYGGPRPMVLGGIPIPGGPGIHAHSDGDVLMHALVDAILGCLGKGDIGDLFPDTDPQLENMSSSVFLAEALLLAEKENLQIVHIDITIIAQIPRISPYKNQIKSNLLGLTGLEHHQISVKATTEEKLGFTGAEQGIKAVALVTGTKQEK